MDTSVSIIESSFDICLNHPMQIKKIIPDLQPFLQKISFKRLISIEEIACMFLHPLIEIPSVQEFFEYSQNVIEMKGTVVCWKEGAKIGEQLLVLKNSRIQKIPCPSILDMSYRFVFKTPKILGVLLIQGFNNISKYMRISRGPTD